MSLANSLSPTITDVITQFGSDGVLKSASGSTYDTSTGTVTKTQSDTNIKIIVESYQSNELNENIQTGDLKFLVVLSSEPKLSDIVTFNGKSYNIVHIQPNILQNVVLFYTLQVRSW